MRIFFFLLFSSNINWDTADFCVYSLTNNVVFTPKIVGVKIYIYCTCNKFYQQNFMKFRIYLHSKILWYTLNFGAYFAVRDADFRFCKIF